MRSKPTFPAYPAFSALAIGLTLPGFAAAQTVGFDDFDTSVAGTDYATRVISPDNSGNFSFDGVTPGVFAGSNFDIFGITNRNVGFDWADDSAGSFPGDTNGFAGTGADDPGNFLAAADLVNGNNPSGIGEATWTFDVTGLSNLAVSIDAVAWGDFETSDIFLIEASIDGGTPVTVFNGSMTAAQDDADIQYSLQMDGGATPDRAPFAFFDAAEYQFLVDNMAAIQATADPFTPEIEFDPDGTPNNGDEVLIGYSTLDDGVTNGDTTALDGIVPNTGAAGTFDEFAYQVTNDFGSFDEIENAPFVDPLFDLVTNTQLNNELQTFTAALTDTGSTLTVTLLATSNGGGEQFAIDNLRVFVDAGVIEGDFNGDGFVSQGDLDLVLLNWGNAVVPAGFDEGALSGGGPFDGLVSQNELDDVLLNWGNGTPPTLAVPEPTAAALLGLGGLALLRRRSA